MTVRCARCSLAVHAGAQLVLVVQKLACKKLGQQAQQYKQLLDALNDVAHHEIDEWMRQEQHLSEPFVARTISQQLPPGMPRSPFSMQLPF